MMPTYIATRAARPAAPADNDNPEQPAETLKTQLRENPNSEWFARALDGWRIFEIVVAEDGTPTLQPVALERTEEVVRVERFEVRSTSGAVRARLDVQDWRGRRP
jgi:hypothetical protein